jgi:protein involved in polysaccharide export with SLBB domain
VRVVPLLRVLVRGGVVHAGYYALPADQLLSDAIMAAGGPNALAKLSHSELKRGDKQVYSPKEFARLVQDGASLDQAHLRPGDEIVVGEKGHQNWAAIFQGIGAVMGIITLVYTFGNR